jgi:hypothetical protein
MVVQPWLLGHVRRRSTSREGGGQRGLRGSQVKWPAICNCRESSKFQNAAKTNLPGSCTNEELRRAAVTKQELASVSNIRPFSGELT